MQILNSLFPIFAVIGLGIALRRFGFLTQGSTKSFNEFAYFVALPVFLFYKIGSAPLVGNTATSFFVTLLVATLVAGIVAWVATIVMGVKFGSRGAYIQACFRGNLAFLGLPVILFATYELPESQRNDLNSAVLVAIAPMVILYNIGSVGVLALFNEASESNFSWKTVWTNMFLNPLLLSVFAGLLFNASGLTLPTPVFRTCEVLGRSAFPIALLGIGSQLAVTSIASRWGEPIAVSMIKCVVCPLVGWGVASGLGITGPELKAILILCAVPTAISSYVLADQMKGDSDLAASSVVICTGVSLLTLSVLLALCG